MSNKPPKDLSKKLTDMQDLFCKEYLVDLNATKAAKRAGFAEKSAQSQSSDMMADPRIQSRIAELNRERMDRLEINADTVLRGLLEIATADLGEAYDDRGHLKNIKDIPPNVRRAMSGAETEIRYERGLTEDDEPTQVATTKVKFWDKPKSLELLGKHLKLFVEKHEHTFPEIADRVARGRQRAAEQAAKKIEGTTNNEPSEDEHG